MKSRFRIWQNVTCTERHFVTIQAPNDLNSKKKVGIPVPATWIPPYGAWAGPVPRRHFHPPSILAGRPPLNFHLQPIIPLSVLGAACPKSKLVNGLNLLKALKSSPGTASQSFPKPGNPPLWASIPHCLQSHQEVPLVSSKVLIVSILTLGNTVRQFLAQSVGRKKRKKEKKRIQIWYLCCPPGQVA